MNSEASCLVTSNSSSFLIFGLDWHASYLNGRERVARVMWYLLSDIFPNVADQKCSFRRAGARFSVEVPRSLLICAGYEYFCSPRAATMVSAKFLLIRLISLEFWSRLQYTLSESTTLSISPCDMSDSTKSFRMISIGWNELVWDKIHRNFRSLRLGCWVILRLDPMHSSCG